MGIIQINLQVNQLPSRTVHYTYTKFIDVLSEIWITEFTE